MDHSDAAIHISWIFKKLMLKCNKKGIRKRVECLILVHKSIYKRLNTMEIPIGTLGKK